MRSYLVRTTSIIAGLLKSGNVVRARKLFDEMTHRDAVVWNAMISGYSHMGLHQEALYLFTNMRFSNIKPDHFTFTSVLNACAGLKDVSLGRKFHALVTVYGCLVFLPVNNALMNMYGKCLSVEEVNKVFEDMEVRNEVSWCTLLFAYVNAGLLDAAFDVFRDMPRRVIVAWNTIIAGYSKWGENEFCLDLFKRMLKESWSPDQWTLSSVMNACAEMNEPCCGRMLHGFVIQRGWDSAVEASNSILSFYTKLGEEIEILKAVEAVGQFNEVSSNAIIDANMKIGNVDGAYLVFQGIPEKNLITWTSMISGCVRNGHGEHALQFFVDLIQSSLWPDDVAFGAVLHACSSLGTLNHGRMIHSCVVRSGFHDYAYVGNGLVNMYAKCGDISDSHKAFNDILEKDLVSWNTVLFAYGMHGCSSQVLRVLDEMVASGLKPDKITFIGLLMACRHTGMIEEGLFFFEYMSSEYGLSPEIDHLVCVVDMLGRGGKVEKAKELVNTFVEDNNMRISSMETLLGSCLVQENLMMGAELGERLQILKPLDEMSYVLLSNMYCANEQWEQAQTLRKTMAEKGVKKMPGCSWVEVRNQVICFVAGMESSSYMEEVHMMLYILDSDLRCPWSIFVLVE